MKKQYSWEWVDKQVEKIGDYLESIETPKFVTGVPRGGLILAVMMSHRLGIKHMTIDHLEKLEEFNLNIDNKNILIVDDISDSGQTLKHYKKQGYTTATIDVRNTTITKPDYYCNWIETADWIVYPWEEKDSKTLQDYLDN